MTARDSSNRPAFATPGGAPSGTQTVDGRAEGKQALARVARSLVIDVVQDETVEVEVVQPLDGGARSQEPLSYEVDRLERGDREQRSHRDRI